MSRPPRVGLNLFADPSFRAAAGPLFDDGIVDALEWDIDESFGWGEGDRLRALPPWIDALLDLYGEDDALYGHGVWFSLLSARFEARQERWLAQLTEACRRRRYRHLSEHFGFHAAAGYTRGTMFPVPFTDGAVRVGRDRLRRIAAASGLRVGVENTSVALVPRDAEEQGAFLGALLDGGEDFLVLDLHNLWTQCRNLGLSADAMMQRYPLERVRELHVSGGSWYQPDAEAARGPLRLDSHDGPVPAEAFALVQPALRACPNVEVVFLEQRGANLGDATAVAQYQQDFRALRALVEQAS
ncbi:MAG: multinuclear nonheme iron-dependent oxidase [Polyangia bacterium]